MTPPRTLWASGKRIKNSYTSPAKRRRGGPSSSPAPAAASPGLVSPAVSPSIFIPQIDHPTFSLLHSSRSWISSALHVIPYSPALSVRRHLCYASTSSFPLHRRWLLSSTPPTGVRPC
ncbi:hypothetical protein AMECASPLE_027342 [Ameca splendens]|uniref:Uncharacterized protein n=1 Tax=Ameca splendens TaxID=208324 RepID=A0ABV0Y5Q5_9TELE